MRPVPDVGDAPPATRSFTATARRAQLVDTAITTIAELGYARTSLAKVAARAGVSKGVISYHFTGKDELVAEALAEINRSVDAVVLPRVVSAANARDSVRRYLRAWVKYFGQHPDRLQALGEIQQSLSADRNRAQAAPSALEATDPALTLLATALTDGQDAGQLRAFDVSVMTASIQGALEALRGRLARDPGLDLGAYSGELTALFDAAIAPQRSGKK